MKLEKNERTPHIMKTTKHFNDVSGGGASPGGPGGGEGGVGAAHWIRPDAGPLQPHAVEGARASGCSPC